MLVIHKCYSSSKKSPMTCKLKHDNLLLVLARCIVQGPISQYLIIHRILMIDRICVHIGLCYSYRKYLICNHRCSHTSGVLNSYRLRLRTCIFCNVLIYCCLGGLQVLNIDARDFNTHVWSSWLSG